MKAADPNAKLLIGGLARGGQNSNPQYPQKLLAAGALNNFDIMNYHTYDKKEAITNQFNGIKAAVGGKPIWITEIGFSSEGGEDTQADYMKDILPHLINLGAQRVFWYTLADVPRDDTSFCKYGLVYIPGKQCVGSSAGNTTGGDLKTKKSFEAFKSLIQ